MLKEKNKISKSSKKDFKNISIKKQLGEFIRSYVKFYDVLNNDF